MKLPSNISWYKNKRIAVVGLSVEGVDSATFLTSVGARVFCLDRRTREELGDTYDRLSSMTDAFVLGPSYISDVSSYDMIVRSPGIAVRTPAFQSAVANGQIMTSLTGLFFAHCSAPIIGVTGTKGKGTTSSLIYDMLLRLGRKAWLGGNIGSPLLSQVQNIGSTDIVVLELSSFQLEDLTISPHVSVVLKITQEHLANFDPNATNYHESREAYVAAKKSIILYQQNTDYIVYTPDDETSRQFADASSAQRKAFSRYHESADAFVRDTSVYFRENGVEHLICSLGKIQSRGIHNLENIAAATCAARLVNVPIETIRDTAIAFKGLEHRLEFVRVLGNVTYINDSFSTVPETAIAAIESFTDPLILVIGGSEKGSDYSQLGKKIASSNIRALIVIGNMTNKLLSAIHDAGYGGVVITGLHTMKEIVTKAKESAQPGDVVLLSPACASFDMFKNYKERGRLFKDEVEQLI